MTRSN